MDKKKFSDLQESRIAKYLNWKQVSGSGAKSFHPGDVIGDKYLGECKTHVSPGHRLIFSFSVWDKIEKEANSQFRKPVLFVDDGSQEISKTWCMVEITGYVSGKVGTLDCTDRSSISISLDDTLFWKQKNIVFSRGQNKYILIPLKEFKEFCELEA